jgi:hypothetical protein
MHQRATLPAWICAGLLSASAAFGQIYKTTDEHGNVVFTDKPPAGKAEQVELNRLNTTPATRPQPRPPAGEEKQAEESPQYRVAIQSPADDTTIPMGPGNFAVQASTQPPLEQGERLQLVIDGEQQGEAQVSGNWQLTNVFRGAHQLTVQRQSAEGEVLATSEAVTVYVHRPSVLFNNHPNNNRPNNNRN